MKIYRDTQFWFFALGAALALAISAPNTYQIAAPLHGGGTEWYGIALTVALVILLEAGAVGAEIAGVRWLSISLLTLTFVANVTIGSAAFDLADLSATPSLLAWRASGWGWLLVLCYSASVPVLLWLFLHYALKRAAELSAAADVPSTAHTDTSAVLEALAAAIQIAGAGAQSGTRAMDETVSALRNTGTPAQSAIQATYPRPTERTEPMVMRSEYPEVCPACGAQATPMQLRTAAQHGGWRCRTCGKKVSAE